MVVPLSFNPGEGGDTREPVPAVIVERHSIFWWVLFSLFIVLLVLQVAAASVFTAIYSGVAAFWIWFMVRNSCQEMSQICLVLFGVMCFLQFVFDTVILFTMIGGRREHKTVMSSSSAHTATYKTTVTTHPFFDSSMGLVYNFQSAARMFSPVVMLLGACLSYYSTKAYESDLFGGDGGLAAAGRGGGGGFAAYGAAGPIGGTGGAAFRAGGPIRQPEGSTGRQPGQGFSAFEGQGQRLGDS